jgi:HAD superfamily hydrolase (TIGR01509 family)
MSKYSAILWDNDGILVETEHLYMEATRRVLASVGFDLTKELFRQHFLQSSQGVWHLALAENPKLDVEALKAQRGELYSELLQTEDILIPGVTDVLEQLKGGFRMAVVTSSRKEHFNIIHERSGLLGYFEFVLASGVYPRSKPDPSPYQMGVEKIGLPHSKCLAIEDSERGLRSAKAAGIDCWCIPSHLTKDSDFSLADRVLDSISRLTELIERS